MEERIYCELLIPVLGIHLVSQKTKAEVRLWVIFQQISANIYDVYSTK
jgi:hypothetical protein